MMPAGDNLSPASSSTLSSIIAAATATSTTSASLATATASMTSPMDSTSAFGSPAEGSPDGPDGPPEGSSECRLLGSFALWVQLALGGLAILSLVYKRSRERPQRPLKIWSFDVSKQVVGSVLVHVANVLMSMLTSGRFSVKLDASAIATASSGTDMVATLAKRQVSDDYVPNPCSLYLLNLAIDTTVGIPILIVLLRVFTGLVAFTSWGEPPESIQSGHYGSPPKAWWWLKQSVIYFCGLLGMKFCVLVIFLILPWIARVGDWALSWTEGNERLQIIFVMMLFPLMMNAMQYYIIDSFIKAQEPDSPSLDRGDHGHGHERLPTADPDHEVPAGRSFDDSTTELGDDPTMNGGPGMDMAGSPGLKKIVTMGSGQPSREYDPNTDGYTSNRASDSEQQDRRKMLPKELLPPE